MIEFGLTQRRGEREVWKAMLRSVSDELDASCANRLAKVVDKTLEFLVQADGAWVESEQRKALDAPDGVEQRVHAAYSIGFIAGSNRAAQRIGGAITAMASPHLPPERD